MTDTSELTLKILRHFKKQNPPTKPRGRPKKKSNSITTVCLCGSPIYRHGVELSKDTVNVLLETLLVEVEDEEESKDSSTTWVCGRCSSSLGSLVDLFLQLEALKQEFNELRRRVGHEVIVGSLKEPQEIYEGWLKEVKSVEDVYPSGATERLQRTSTKAPTDRNSDENVYERLEDFVKTEEEEIFADADDDDMLASCGFSADSPTPEAEPPLEDINDDQDVKLARMKPVVVLKRLSEESYSSVVPTKKSRRVVKKSSDSTESNPPWKIKSIKSLNPSVVDSNSNSIGLEPCDLESRQASKPPKKKRGRGRPRKHDYRARFFKQTQTLDSSGIEMVERSSSPKPKNKKLGRPRMPRKKLKIKISKKLETATETQEDSPEWLKTKEHLPPSPSPASHQTKDVEQVITTDDADVYNLDDDDTHIYESCVPEETEDSLSSFSKNLKGTPKKSNKDVPPESLRSNKEPPPPTSVSVQKELTEDFEVITINDLEADNTDDDIQIYESCEPEDPPSSHAKYLKGTSRKDKDVVEVITIDGVVYNANDVQILDSSVVSVPTGPEPFLSSRSPPKKLKRTSRKEENKDGPPKSLGFNKEPQPPSSSPVFPDTDFDTRNEDSDTSDDLITWASAKRILRPRTSPTKTEINKPVKEVDEDIREVHISDDGGDEFIPSDHDDDSLSSDNEEKAVSKAVDHKTAKHKKSRMNSPPQDAQQHPGLTPPDTQKNRKCPVCPKSFRRPYELTHHLRTTHLTTQIITWYPCLSCGEEFPDLNQMRTHAIIHSKKKLKLPGKDITFGCPGCPSRIWTRKDHLVEHLRRVHSLDLQFQEVHCEICKRTFSRYDKLEMHMRHAHPHKVHLGYVAVVNQPLPIIKQCRQVNVGSDEYPEYFEDDEEQTEVLDFSKMPQERLTMNLYFVRKLRDKIPCGCCDLSFSDQNDLRSHLLDKHTLYSGDPEIKKCSWCLKLFLDEKELEIHVEKTHEVTSSSEGRLPNNIQCSVCDEIPFESIDELEVHAATEGHLEKVKSKLNFHCNICRVKLEDTREALEIHLMSNGHLEEEQTLGNFDQNSFCIACRVDCWTAEGLEAHKTSSYHSKWSQFPKEVVPEYPEVTTDNVEVETTNNDHEQESGMNSQDIDENNSTSEEPRSQESPIVPVDGCPEVTLKSNPEDSNECHICHKTFKFSIGLRKHFQQSHQTPNPTTNPEDIPNEYKCDKCELSFETEDTLSSHKTTSHPFLSGDTPSPLTCRICRKEFNTETGLEVHERSHNSKWAAGGKKVWLSRCPLCPQTFLTPYQLRRHKVREHPEETLKDTPHICQVCFLVFKTEEELKDLHMKVHEWLKCSECQVYFRTNDKYLNHMRTHTGEKPFPCSLCGKKFSSKTYVQQHMKKCPQLQKT